jgi:hypothetical protein
MSRRILYKQWAAMLGRQFADRIIVIGAHDTLAFIVPRSFSFSPAAPARLFRSFIFTYRHRGSIGHLYIIYTSSFCYGTLKRQSRRELARSMPSRVIAPGDFHTGRRLFHTRAMYERMCILCADRGRKQWRRSCAQQLVPCNFLPFCLLLDTEARFGPCDFFFPAKLA